MSSSPNQARNQDGNANSNARGRDDLTREHLPVLLSGVSQLLERIAHRLPSDELLEHIVHRLPSDEPRGDVTHGAPPLVRGLAPFGGFDFLM